METKFIRALVGLGIPGIVLGIFYLLLRTFSFEFSQVDATWTAAIAIISLLIIGGITFYALYHWAPQKSKIDHSGEESDNSGEGDNFVFKVGEEIVTFEEKMISLGQDVVKINAHTHPLGVAAEYQWIDRKYPDSETIEQSLTTLELLTGEGEYKACDIHFDVIKIKMSDGREKEIYFDITSFFNGVSSSTLDKNGFIGRKLLA